MSVEFVSFPKIPRLRRGCLITEKIDGTNAAVGITEDGEVYAQSRKRLIHPGKTTDNAGFAGWVQENEDALRVGLGPGLHFGEWWGAGIQRRYGLDEKRFSLFNTGRWSGTPIVESGLVSVVPVLYAGVFDTDAVDRALEELRTGGSVAAPGFMDPEGVVVFLSASRTLFKATIIGDDTGKEQDS
jgi:hypothetical protein